MTQQGKLKCSLIFDEFPTLVATGIVSTISTARSNLVSYTLGIQSIEQLKKEYGAEFAEIIARISDNIISGQVTSDSAKKLSETFGKIMQDRESLSINSSDTSVSKSTQLYYAVPASKIVTLSSGEFVGIVADSPDQRIKLKMFHAELQNYHEAIAKEEAAYVPIPIIREVSYEDMQKNYMKIKKNIWRLVKEELTPLETPKQKSVRKPVGTKRPIRKSVPGTTGRRSKSKEQSLSL